VVELQVSGYDDEQEMLAHVTIQGSKSTLKMSPAA
jgi:hypothetical protein